MCFHGNQHPWAIKHPFISIYCKYQPLKYICFHVMNSPAFPSLDDIYCMKCQLHWIISGTFSFWGFLYSWACQFQTGFHPKKNQSSTPEASRLTGWRGMQRPGSLRSNSLLLVYVCPFVWEEIVARSKTIVLKEICHRCFIYCLSPKYWGSCSLYVKRY